MKVRTPMCATGWLPREARKGSKASRTPGEKKRADTCQLSSIGGRPRKFWVGARSFKDKRYGDFCDFSMKVNGLSK